MSKKIILNLLIICMLFGNVKPIKSDPSTFGLILFLFPGMITFASGLFCGIWMGIKTDNPKQDQVLIDNLKNSIGRASTHKDQIDLFKYENEYSDE